MLRIKIPKPSIRDCVDELYLFIDSGLKEPLQEYLSYCYLRYIDFINDSYLQGYTILNYAIKQNNVFAVELLLQNRSILKKLEVPDKDGYSPLLGAIHNKNNAIINILIKERANLTKTVLKKLMMLKSWP